MRGEGAINAIIGIAVWGLIIWGIASLVGGNGSGSDYESSYDDEEYVSEPENPYSDGTGHSAGYEWAEENEVDSCGGNSQSFIEGCEDYLEQRDTYESYEYEAEDYYYDEYDYGY